MKTSIPLPGSGAATEMERGCVLWTSRSGSKQRECCGWLTKALESKEAGLRGNSAGALGKIGPGAGAAIPALERAMNDPDAGVRRNAAFSLWQIDGRTNVVGILIERLKSEENLNVLERLNATSTRLFDIGQLGEIGPQAKAALPLLREIVKGDDERLRAAAQKALEKIQGGGKPEGEVSAAPTPGELFKQLVTYQSRQKRSQAKLLDQFTRSQPSVVPFLIEQLENQTKPSRAEALESRRKAAWILSEMGTAAKPALPTLVKALEDDDERVAQSAADALGAIGPEAKEAMPALMEVLKFQINGAARALARIAPESPQVVSVLIEAFENNGYRSRDQLLFVLADMKCDKERLEATFLAAQQDPEPHIRSTAAFALNRIGAKSSEALAVIRAWHRQNATPSDQEPMNAREALQKLKNPQDRRDSYKALEALTRLGPEAAEAVPALVDYLKDPNTEYHANAASALAAIGPAAKDAVPALIAFLKDQKNRGRPNAVSALGEIGPAAKAAVPVLIDALEDDERGVSGNALRSLGLIGPEAKAAIPLIQEALRSGDPRSRLQAAASLWRIDASLASTCVPLLVELLEHPPADLGDLSFYLSKVLAEIGSPAKSALPALTRLFKQSKNDQGWSLAAAICRIDPEQTAAILPQIVKALEDKNTLNRAAVAYVLGEMGKLAKPAVPALEAAAKDTDLPLQTAAKRALEKISIAAKP